MDEPIPPFTLCTCTGVTREQVLSALACGCRSVTDLQVVTGVCTGCRTCRPELEQLIDDWRRTQARRQRSG